VEVLLMPNAYEKLSRVKANFVPLSPLSFIERSAKVYPNRMSVIHGQRRYTWSQTYARARQLASALNNMGIGKGDTVAIMGANTPETYEAHFGVPMAGAVLNTLNIRLDAATISFILDHGDAKVLLTDREFSATIKEALRQCASKPFVVDIDDTLAHDGELIGKMEYETFINSGDREYDWRLPEDEWQALSLNYTSGTTGNPKGVVYSHRGAYMNSIGNAMAWNLNQGPIYLWTLPMFHCNGWCFPWTVAAYGGTNVCLRNVSAKEIYNAIDEYRIDHFCGAPIVLGMLVNAAKAEIKKFNHTIEVMTAGAPPPATILQKISKAGFRVTHTYGLTETYGPATVCAWQNDWDELPEEEKAAMNARQGVNYAVLDKLSVLDPNTMLPVPPDGKTMGEVMFRGNNVMKGYLKNSKATEDATDNGWFHSGDLGVMHPDGYVQLKDRSKDIIISGGENISSIEVESILYKHPSVLAAAVVAKEDKKWGETPCAFIELKPDANVITEEQIIMFCRDNLAHFKCPRHVIFGDLPKTSTGKIQKFVLRDRAKD
jgi:fatty-acyl-CoA synthase